MAAPEARLTTTRSGLFVHVLDAGLVKQQVGAFGAIDLEAALVVPLDHTVQGLAVTQHKNHGSLSLHLLDVVKVLGIRLVRGHRLFLRRGGSPRRRDLLLDLVQRRTNEFTIKGFHGTPSFRREYDWPSRLGGAALVGSKCPT